MERGAALKKLRAILGKNLGYRVDPRALDAEGRAAAKDQLAALIPERDRLSKREDERRRAVLAADAEYQNLLTTRKLLSKEVDRLHSLSHHYRFTVGISNGMFFHIKAEGDSWEEVIRKLEGRPRTPGGGLDLMEKTLGKLL